MTFDMILGYARSHDSRIARQGWNGKDMYVFIVNEWNFWDGEDIHLERLPFLAMKTADDKIVPWLASQTDLLAHDWVLFD